MPRCITARRLIGNLAASAALATMLFMAPVSAEPTDDVGGADAFTPMVADRATDIVRGVIVEAVAERSGEGPGGRLNTSSINTIFTLETNDGDAVPIVVEGGTLDGLTQHVAHQAELRVGQSVTLALAEVAGRYSVVGGPRGVILHEDAPSDAGEPADGLTHNRSLLTTDYVLHGDRWDYPSLNLDLWVNPNGSGVGQVTTVQAIVDGAMTWQDDPQSGVEVTYKGTNPSISVADPTDFVNVVFWADTPNPAHTFLAKASWYEYAADPGTIVGFDVHFNNDYNWDVNPSLSEYDIESTMLHEMGHVLGLDHAPDSSNAMHDSLGDGQLRRSLGPGDRAGILALYPLAATPTCNGFAATITGTSAGETLYGTNGRDVIVAGGGDDIIYAYAGNDLICGEAGRDRIYAGTGSDTVYGGSEIDYVWGDLGVDYLYGEGGSDRLWGGDQNDFLYGDSGADRIFGGNGNDTIAGQGGQDFIWGDAGDDSIGGNWQTDTIYGGTGNDTIYGHGGKDKLYGDAGSDKLYGGENTDTLSGGADNDQLDGGRGTDNLAGNGGTDILNGGKHTDTCTDTAGTTYISC